MNSPADWTGRLVAPVLLAAIGAAGPIQGQSSVPDSVARRIDSVFTQYARPQSPGCALGVYRDGRVVYAQGYGSANLELNVPLTPASVLDIGSTSKQFTAMSILLLAHDGRLRLEDDVRKYIPELPDYGQRITISHLLHHTSGIRDYNALLELAGEATENWTTDADGLDIIVRQRALNFRPGTEWQYSNSGFFLLSLIVKRITGQSLRQFAQARIFGPLGMTHTHFHDDHTMIVPSRATGYAPSDSGNSFRIEMSNWEQTGDGSVLTTVEDLLKWDENFYSGTVGGPAVLAEMVRPGRLNNGKVLDYASGLFLGEYRGLKTVEHGGAWAGYRSQLLRFPTEHVSVACLCNLSSANPDGLAQQVADVYLGDRLGPPRPGISATAESGAAPVVSALSASQLRAAVGTYRDPKLGSVARVVLSDGKPVLKYSGASLELRPISPNEFRLIDFDARLRVIPSDGSRPQRIQLSAPGLGEPVFEAITPERPTPADLAVLAGEYFSPELQSSYRIARERGALVLHARHLPAVSLEPTMRDEFEYPPYGLILHFQRQGARVTGFTLASDRTQGIEFLRRHPSSQR